MYTCLYVHIYIYIFYVFISCYMFRRPTAINRQQHPKLTLKTQLSRSLCKYISYSIRSKYGVSFWHICLYKLWIQWVFKIYVLGVTPSTWKPTAQTCGRKFHMCIWLCVKVLVFSIKHAIILLPTSISLGCWRSRGLETINFEHDIPYPPNFSQSYRASWYYKILFFANWCTKEFL